MLCQEPLGVVVMVLSERVRYLRVPVCFAPLGEVYVVFPDADAWQVEPFEFLHAYGGVSL